MVVGHFLAVASVLVFLSCSWQCYCCDGGRVPVVNDFCACCFAHILQKALSRPFFGIRLYVRTPSENWAFASEFNVSVNCQGPGTLLWKAVWYRRKSSRLELWVLIPTLPLIRIVSLDHMSFRFIICKMRIGIMALPVSQSRCEEQNKILRVKVLLDKC